MPGGRLVRAMEKGIKGNIKYATTPHDIWLDLEEIFRIENVPVIYKLKKTISTICHDKMMVNVHVFNGTNFMFILTHIDLDSCIIFIRSFVAKYFLIQDRFLVPL